MNPIHQNCPQNKNNYNPSVLFYTAVKQLFGKLFLLFLVLLSNLVIGQNLPTAVDNSKWFPPAGTQYWNSCHVYSMTYLKDYYWNHQYNRDPKLAQNQFSPYFVWNLEISPLGHWMESYGDFNFMKQQGCTTVNEFSSQGESQEIVPSLISREKALSYKSKNLTVKDLGVHTETQATAYLNDLKKSLSDGVCFTLHFPLFKSIDNLYNDGESVYSYENNKIADMYNSHVAVVVGYDDNIVTKSGKGALKLLNSWGDVFGDNGYFYLDYNFFKIPDWNFACYFLEEDFNHVTDLYLSLNLSQAVTGDNIANKDYIFADGVESADGKNYDFADNTYYDYSHGRNLVKVRSINKQKNASFGKIIYINSHNHDGNHQIVSDLTDYVRSADFKSMEVIVQDPVSSSYVGGDDKVIYSYTRQAKVGVVDTHIKLMNNGKLIAGKVQDLPDTTIVVNNFYSRLVGAHLTPQTWQEVYVKSCTSVLKRKLITFSIDGAEVNTPPVFTQVPSSETTVTRGDVVNLQVTAQDPEGKPLIYSVVNGNGTIDQTGKFTYSATQSGTFSFAVKVSDGVNDITTSFNIKVLDPVVETLAFTKVPGSEVIIAQEELYSFQFAATGPKGKTLTFSLTGNPDWSFLKITFNEQTGEFSFWCDGTHMASLLFTVKVSDGVNSVSTEFKVTVKEKANTPPTFINLPGVLTTSQNATLTHQFEATDKENNTLIFSLLNPGPEATISTNGLLTFKSAADGTFDFTVVVSDGHVSVNQAVTVKVTTTSVNTAPVFVNPPTSLSAYTNKIFSYQFVATDKENDPLIFSLSSSIQGVSLSSKGLLNVYFTTAITLKLKVIVSDGPALTSQDVTVEVKDVPNTPPVFVDPGVLSALTGKTFNYQFVVNDKENDHIIFLLSYPVPEATITNDGLLTFKSNVVGLVQFAVVANDGLALTNCYVTVRVENALGVEDLIGLDSSLNTYPNPFKGTTNFEVTLAKNQFIRLVITDSTGRVIAIVADGEYNAGKQEFAFDGTAFPDGIYFCSLQTEEGIKTIKLIKNSLSN